MHITINAGLGLGLCRGLALSKVLALRRNLQEGMIAFMQVLIHEATRFVNNAGS